MIEHNPLSIGSLGVCHKTMSIRLLDEWTFECPIDISVCPMDEWTFECPMNISVCPMDEWTFECPMDISVCPIDRRIEISVCLVNISNAMDEWTLSDGKHSSLLFTSGYAQSYYVIMALLSDALKVTCPLDIQKYLIVHRTNRNVHWTFKCPFVHWTNRNVQWTLKCPFVQWTNGHCLMANTSASYRQGVMLNHITSL